MFLIFGDKGSGAFSAEAALAEVGAPYEFKTISLDKNEQRSPEFLAINPSGKMPAVRLPEGQILTESLAILLTVADHFPNARLLPPQASPDRGTAYRWLAFMAAEIYPMVEISDYPERFAPAGDQAEALRQKARERIRDRLSIVERQVAGPWFLPSGFSILDIYAAMFSRWRGSIGRDWSVDRNIPNLLALAAAVSERERIVPVWRRHFPR
ncbi:MAG: glutathione S-transferase family protein [Alphaproteobacteria bacterium]|uniref:glutathione S-transferase family protein n=1 Tax=Bradyrhizobium sp. TaxID=376 RepID=UPI001ED4AACA|nr:glutathione S-transferase family protein [Bradyrhizobium sp.]MBV9570823.1 glutathione S-transferase family protein [Alphaproteobacteria bacterium]MBV9979073.1 glutathione S-transferase family protein [Bradyrhizobium sp.]